MYEILNKYLQVEDRSIVIIGDFTPVLFQPYWLQSKNIIGELAAKTAKVDIISNEFSQFHIEGWLDFTVTRNKMQLKTRQNPYFQTMKDIVIQILSLIKNTPVIAIGLNYMYYLGLQNKRNYYKIGDQLASLSRWDNLLKRPTLGNMIIRGDIDENRCITQIDIHPSEEEIKIDFGIAAHINNHFSYPNMNSDIVSQIANDHFDNYAVSSKKIVENVIKSFLPYE